MALHHLQSGLEFTRVKNYNFQCRLFVEKDAKGEDKRINLERKTKLKGQVNSTMLAWRFSSFAFQIGQGFWLSVSKIFKKSRMGLSPYENSIYHVIQEFIWHVTFEAKGKLTKNWLKVVFFNDKLSCFSHHF